MQIPFGVLEDRCLGFVTRSLFSRRKNRAAESWQLQGAEVASFGKYLSFQLPLETIGVSAGREGNEFFFGDRLVVGATREALSTSFLETSPNLWRYSESIASSVIEYFASPKSRPSGVSPREKRIS